MKKTICLAASETPKRRCNIGNLIVSTQQITGGVRALLEHEPSSIFLFIFVNFLRFGGGIEQLNFLQFYGTFLLISSLWCDHGEYLFSSPWCDRGTQNTVVMIQYSVILSTPTQYEHCKIMIICTCNVMR